MNWHLKNIPLYPKNAANTLDAKLFANPSAEYRGTPFWAWNAKLDRETLFRQIEAFREMGLGGFHMHARTGLDTAYLSDEFMQLVRECTLKARDLSMIAWLYDEDRWPSGSAGGLVTCDHALRSRHLLWTSTPYSGKVEQQSQDSAARGSRQENGRLLARYEVTLKGGCLASYRRLGEKDKPARSATVWYAYLEVAGNSSWYNNQAYVDTLNPRAIQKFVEVTHERYAQAIGEFFGPLVPAMFTDEPQFTHKGQFNNAAERRDIVLPFTDDFFVTYAKTYGQGLENFLPELFWELPDGTASVARYRYHDHVAERFAGAFADTCGKWCLEHGIALTGHMMEEPTLQSQTAALGDAMRSYRAFQLPGIDMLCDQHEYTTAKQAQSAAHQYGRPGVLSELYGVTNWDFSFVGHKAQGDWQAALGVTVRVPHLAWVSMAGEAKRDYPAAIDYHSPWYREYSLIENHFSRINVAMTRGKPVIRVGVIHPVESYWLAFGPLEQTKLAREELERAFSNVTNWLLFGLVDFNFVSESLLPELNAKQTGKRFKAGQMAYDVVVVPAMRTIRATTMDRLEVFVAEGGRVVFAGGVPTLVDAKPSNRPAKLAKKSTVIDLSRGLLLDALEDVREVDVRYNDGGRANAVLSQLRQDGKNRHLLLAYTDRNHGQWYCTIRVRGKWAVRQLDTFTGKIVDMPSWHEGGWTVLKHNFDGHGHLLLSLAPAKTLVAKPKPQTTLHPREIGRLADRVPVTLSEPNVLLLDQAQWRLDEGQWQPMEEVLRIDNLARAHYKLSERQGGIAQPWTDTQPDVVVGSLSLRFAVDCEVDVKGTSLALEDVAYAKITLDGAPINNQPAGFWVDEAIKTVALSPISAGRHELVVTYAYSRKRNVEWMYLLGAFGVKVEGRYARIIAPVRELAFGDYVNQGLPFYAGNVTYHCQIESSGQAMAIAVPHFKAPLLSADLDGRPCGKIAFAPYRLELGKLTPGSHKLDITAYGNRVNAFGAVHNINQSWTWHGPESWRTTGADWSDEYQLKSMGILAAPMVQTKNT